MIYVNLKKSQFNISHRLHEAPKLKTYLFVIKKRKEHGRRTDLYDLFQAEVERLCAKFEVTSVDAKVSNPRPLARLDGLLNLGL